MTHFKVKILAADKPFYEGEALSLIVPTVNGQFGILAHHSNTLGATVPGLLKITYPDNREEVLSVSSGIFKIEHNHVLVLVDSLERPEEIDINRAKREADEAKEALLQKMSRQEYYSTQARLARALNRLKIKSNYK